MPHPRLGFHSWPAAVYAVGDVHGCLDQLRELEAEIGHDGLEIEGEKWLVTLGDHIDRGPDAAGVVEHVMRGAPDGFRRFALMGNHEALALDFLAGRDEDDWLGQGGDETLRSYCIDPGLAPAKIAAAFPSAHRQFLEGLPAYLSLPGWLFVHAGIRPGLPLSEQSDDDLLWIRTPFLTSQLTGGLRVVHGHTPGDDIVVTPHRIDVDTACFASGRLSAVRVTPDGRTKFFTVQGAVPFP
jgi:serine/threonine protein phosphatase 1